MFTAYRVNFAIIAIFGVSVVLGNHELSRNIVEDQGQERVPTHEAVVQERWLNPDRRLSSSVNVPAAVAGVTAGTVATFINWATLRGNLWMMRRDMSKINRNVSKYMFDDIGSLKFDINAFKTTIEKDAASLARHKKFSMVRRTMPFRALVFCLPAYTMYHHVAQDKGLRSTVCDYLIRAQDELS